MNAAVVGVLSYLLGTIPWSFVAARLWGGVDLRRIGSGNLGATNVFRALGAWAALGVLALDAAKGVVAVLLLAPWPAAPVLLGATGFATLCAVAAVLGHMFPFYLGFRGGKGNATSAGAFAAWRRRLSSSAWPCSSSLACCRLASCLWAACWARWPCRWRSPSAARATATWMQPVWRWWVHSFRKPFRKLP